MNIEISTCPLCKSDKHVEFEIIPSKLGEVHFQICQRCGLVFQSPRMEAGALQSFYQDGYRTLSQETEHPITKDLVMQEERASRTAVMVQDDITAIRRHLDIGSSAGLLLTEFQKIYKCEGVGVEPGDTYRAFSQDRGIKVFPALEEIPEKGKSFDLISIMHVLEHVDNPIDFLKKLRNEYMAREGYLLIEVPNLFEHHALEIAHLFAFTPETLQQTLEASGFNLIWTKSHGSFRSPVLKLYITALAKVSESPSHELIIRSKPGLILFRRSVGKLKRILFTRFLPDWTWQAPDTLWDLEDEG
jgi:SAM-dependent methyltransferase